MVTGASVMFLLTAMLFLSVVHRETGRVMADMSLYTELQVARAHLGRRLHHGSFVGAGLSLLGLLVTAVGSQLVSDFRPMLPVMLVLSCGVYAVALGLLVRSSRPLRPGE